MQAKEPGCVCGHMEPYSTGKLEKWVTEGNDPEQFVGMATGLRLVECPLHPRDESKQPLAS